MRTRLLLVVFSLVVCVGSFAQSLQAYNADPFKIVFNLSNDTLIGIQIYNVSKESIYIDTSITLGISVIDSSNVITLGHVKIPVLNDNHVYKCNRFRGDNFVFVSRNYLNSSKITLGVNYINSSFGGLLKEIKKEGKIVRTKEGYSINATAYRTIVSKILIEGIDVYNFDIDKIKIKETL